MKASLHRMRLIQDTVAREIRENCDGADVIGEEIQLQRVEKYLADHGLSQEEAGSEVHHLRLFTDKSSADTGSWEKTFSESQGSIESDANLAEATAHTSSVAHEAARTLPEDERGYVISISTKHRVRRLHYLGKCHRVPKVHYQEFEFLGMERPSEDAYDDYCRQCWRKNADDGLNPARREEQVGERIESDPENSEDSEDHSSSTEIDH